jgi:predicted Zn-ribbon and HTH transcriptional regulator
VTSGGVAEGWWRAPDGQWYPPADGIETHHFDDDNGPVPSHRHQNGGGWVADTATVAETAHVGPSASVFGQARVLDSSLVLDNAWVRGEAEISGNARVSGNAVVDGNAVVSDFAEVTGNAHVSGLATLYEHAQVGGSTTLIEPCCITGSTRIFGDKDDAVSDMLKCANGHEMYSGANFCPTCGGEKLRTPVRQSSCPECGTDAVAGASFCGACGQSLRATTISPRAPSPVRHCPSCGSEFTRIFQGSHCPDCGSTLSRAAVPARRAPDYRSPTGYRSPSRVNPLLGITNGTAIAAFVFAFLFWPVGIILGHIARSTIRRTGERGEGLALAALIISYVWGAIVIIVIIVAVAGSRTSA